MSDHASSCQQPVPKYRKPANLVSFEKLKRRHHIAMTLQRGIVVSVTKPGAGRMSHILIAQNNNDFF